MSSKNDFAGHLGAVSAIADAWSSYVGTRETQTQGILANQLGGFPQLTPRSLAKTETRLKADKTDKFLSADGFVVGAPVNCGTPTLFPVAHALLRMNKVDKVLECSVRVVLFRAHQQRAETSGWRFDMADPRPTKAPPGPPSHRGHYFAHAQPIVAWRKKGRAGLLYEDFVAFSEGAGSESSTGVNVLRPAFPLRCRTAPGLFICVLASLYGSTETELILEDIRSQHTWLLPEADSITGR